MPLYEYECSECGKFEIIQKFSDAPLNECPSCSGKGKHSPVKKMVSLNSFHLKGGGWYKDGYSSGGSASSSSSTSSTSSSASSTSSSDSSSTTASAAAPKACGTGCGCH